MLLIWLLLLIVAVISFVLVIVLGFIWPSWYGITKESKDVGELKKCKMDKFKDEYKVSGCEEVSWELRNNPVAHQKAICRKSWKREGNEYVKCDWKGIPNLAEGCYPGIKCKLS